MNRQPGHATSSTLSTTGSTSQKLSTFTFAYFSNPHEGHPERNEDTILVDQRRGLAAVFDGVGGADAGDVASRLGAKITRSAWKRILQQLQPASSACFLLLNEQLDVEALLVQALQQAQEVLCEEGERRASHRADNGGEVLYLETTVVACALCQRPNGIGYVMGYAHAGDSRAYLLRSGQALQRLTQDDGYFALKVQDKTITEEDALRIDQATDANQLTEVERAIFDKRNGISQSLGYLTPKNPTLTIHTACVALLPGDRVLLCSDGIHDNLTDAEIETILRKGARTTVARQLVRQALERSREESLRAKRDDMSAIVITYNG